MVTAIKILHFNYLVPYRGEFYFLFFPLFFQCFPTKFSKSRSMQLKIDRVGRPKGVLLSLSLSTLVPALSIVPKQALPTPISEKKLFGTPLTFVTYNLVNKMSYVVFMVISVFNMCYS